jgi:hypothetical protein
MRYGLAAVTAFLLFAPPCACSAAGDETGESALKNQSEAAPSAQPAQGDAKAQAPQPAPQQSPTRLHCKAARVDLGMFESLRILSITVDTARKSVKMVHEGDGKTVEFTDGATNAQGNRNFVRFTDETIVFGQGRETWKVDRYTGTLTSGVIAVPFECQVRPSERKF